MSRFAQVWECMGKEKGNQTVFEEAFLWYQELAAYVCATARDQADRRKLYPLLCCRMADNRLRKMFGENAFWEETPWWAKTISQEEKTTGGKVGKAEFSPQKYMITFAEDNMEEQEKIRNAEEYMRILGNLIEGLKELSLAGRQYPLFHKMETMRLILLQKIPLFGEYTGEKNIWRVLGQAWEGLRQAAAKMGVTVDMDSLDPDYGERSVHSFQELLGKRMELHGWGVYELGDAIYADPKKSLTPILEGKSEPKPKKLKALQERIGISWKKYDPGFLTNDDAEYKKYARMARAYSRGEIKEGQRLLAELKEKMDWSYQTNEQFAQYWEALFDWKSGEITEEEKNKEMWKILEYSGAKREKFAEVGCSLSKTEWRALTEIAWNCEGEDKEFLCRVMKKQKEYLKETEMLGFYPEYYIKMLYCLCYLEREMKNLEKAEQYAEEGLAAMYELNLYIQWGAFLFEKFRIVEDKKQGEMEEEDFKYIRQSYAVEKLFLKNNAFCKYIEEYIKQNYDQYVLTDIRKKI